MEENFQRMDGALLISKMFALRKVLDRIEDEDIERSGHVDSNKIEHIHNLNVLKDKLEDEVSESLSKIAPRLVLRKTIFNDLFKQDCSNLTDIRTLLMAVSQNGHIDLLDLIGIVQMIMHGNTVTVNTNEGSNIKRFNLNIDRMPEDKEFTFVYAGGDNVLVDTKDADGIVFSLDLLKSIISFLAPYAVPTRIHEGQFEQRGAVSTAELMMTRDVFLLVPIQMLGLDLDGDTVKKNKDDKQSDNEDEIIALSFADWYKSLMCAYQVSRSEIIDLATCIADTRGGLKLIAYGQSFRLSMTALGVNQAYKSDITFDLDDTTVNPFFFF